jgi:hypothetical protein
MDTRTLCPCTPCGHTSQHPDAASHASCFGYRSNELLKAFERLRVLYYEDTIAADWEWSGHEAPIVPPW